MRCAVPVPLYNREGTMRIIAGDKRGLRLVTMDGEDTRPTLERVKEAMFSSVQFLLPGAHVLDLFAGSGQLGLEALSRGAARCTFVDQSREATDIVKQNARTTGLFEKSRVVTMGAAAFLAQSGGQFDIVMLDPPYRKGTLPQILPAVAGVAAPGAVILCESEPGLVLPGEVGGLVLKKQYRYGTVMVTRYEAAAAL